MKLTGVCLLRASGKTILEINLHRYQHLKKKKICVHHELSFKPWVDWTYSRPRFQNWKEVVLIKWEHIWNN